MDSFQREILKSCVLIMLDLYMGGVQKKVELLLKLFVVGDFSVGCEQVLLVECKKVNIDKNNFDVVLVDYVLDFKVVVENILVGDGLELLVSFLFCLMKDFEFEQVVCQIFEL